MHLVVATGHRPKGFKAGDEGRIGALAQILIADLLSEHDDLVLGSGGADGADRWWARAAWHHQPTAVPYHLYLPHPDYHKHYHGDAAWCRSIVSRAQEVHYTKNTGKFNSSLNFSRNLNMHDVGDEFVLISPKSPKALGQTRSGGTAHMIRTLIASGIPYVYWLDPSANKVTQVKL